MSKQIKAIIMLLILLISLRTPVMAADTDTSSTNIDSTISCSEENQETQFLLPLDPESQLRHLKFELVCAAIIAICAIAAVVCTCLRLHADIPTASEVGANRLQLCALLLLCKTCSICSPLS